ncbi:MAG TPA: alpha/beta hydrolase [Acidimicrobiia bacterium]|nr:alpha/beta hydrolase [Acidimicrobiia bacterium]
MPGTDSVLSQDGIAVAYERQGAGDPALVFVHGWSCDRTYWRHQVAHFAATHEVVAIDLAGHGESGLGRRSWTIPAHGEDVAAVVNELQLDEVILVGHSMGGDVIVETAVLCPPVVKGLVWVDVYSTLGNPRSPESIEQFATPFRTDFAGATDQFVRGMFLPTSDPALVDWVARDMASAPPEVGLGELLYATSNDGPVIERLRRLSMPKIAINPDYRPTDRESLAHYGFETLLMPGVAHFMMLEDPERFNRLLVEAIARIAG